MVRSGTWPALLATSPPRTPAVAPAAARLLLLVALLSLASAVCNVRGTGIPPPTEDLPFPVSTWAITPVADDSPSTGPVGLCDHMQAFDPGTFSMVIMHGDDASSNTSPLMWHLDASSDGELRWTQLDPAAGGTPPAPRTSGVFALQNVKRTTAAGVTTYAQHLFQYSGDEDEARSEADWTLDRSMSRVSSGAGQFTQSDDDTWALRSGDVETLVDGEVLPRSQGWLAANASLLADASAPQTYVPSMAWMDFAWMWTSTQPASAFQPHTDVPPPSEALLVFGGTVVADGGVDTNNTWIANFTGSTDGFPRWYEAFTTGERPPPMSGHKVAVVRGELWMFGGYLCTTDGDTSLGGQECYNRDVYTLGVNPHAANYLEWRVFRWVDHPEQAALWPRERAWHTMSAYQDRYLIVFAGNVIEQSASTFWLNDVSLFDCVRMRWLPLPVRGTLPHVMWSNSVSVLEGKSRGQSDRFVSVGGCTTNGWYMLDTWTLRLGEGIRAANCTLVGPAIEAPIVAGTPTWFEIHTVSHDGEMIAWGTGLEFSVFVGGRDASTGLLGQVDSVVEELGGGVYRVNFTAASGEQYGCTQLTSNVQIVVRLDSVLVPGAPFNVPIVPASVSAATIWGPSSVTQLASANSVAVRGHASSFAVYPQDVHGNPVLLVEEDIALDSLVAGSTPSALELVARRNRTGGLQTALFTVLVDGAASSTVRISDLSLSDGGLAIHYVAPDKESFSLTILYSGSPITGSPFTVTPLSNMDVADAMNIGFIALGFVGLVCLLALLVLVLVKRNDPRIRASSPNFLVLIVLGAIVGMLAMLMPASPRISWAGGMSAASCQAYAWLLGLGFSTTFAALMAKTWRIARIFTSKQIRVVSLPDRELMKPVLGAIIAEALFNTLWTLINPLGVEISYLSNNPNVPLYVCSSDNLQVWQGVTFLVKMILVVWAVKLTSSIRSAPGDFNESSALGAALSNIALCGVVLIPLVFFEALEQSPAALYLLKQMVTFWCFLFSPAIIILPKLLESRGTAGGLVVGSHLATHVKSHGSDDAEGQVLEMVTTTAATGPGNRPGQPSGGTLVTKPSHLQVVGAAAQGNRRWATPASGLNNRKSADFAVTRELNRALVAGTLAPQAANGNGTLRPRLSSASAFPSVASPSDVALASPSGPVGGTAATTANSSIASGSHGEAGANRLPAFPVPVVSNAHGAVAAEHSHLHSRRVSKRGTSSDLGARFNGEIITVPVHSSSGNSSNAANSNASPHPSSSPRPGTRRVASGSVSGFFEQGGGGGGGAAPSVSASPNSALASPSAAAADSGNEVVSLTVDQTPVVVLHRAPS